MRHASNLSTPLIETYFIVRVDEVMKGQTNTRQLVLTQLGGKLDSRGLKIVGDPQVMLGDRYILFLLPDGRVSHRNCHNSAHNSA